MMAQSSYCGGAFHGWALLGAPTLVGLDGREAELVCTGIACAGAPRFPDEPTKVGAPSALTHHLSVIPVPTTSGIPSFAEIGWPTPLKSLFDIAYSSSKRLLPKT